MPSNWSMIDNSFPTFAGDEKAKDQIKTLQNYMYLLVEQLKYNLKNLDTSNWNSTALSKFQKETTKEVEDEVKSVASDLTTTASDLLTLTQEVAALVARVNAMEDLSGRMSDAEINIAFLQKGQEETEERLTDLEESVENIQADMDELMAIFQRGEDGAYIGEDGMDLHLLGNVYINGKLVE